MIETFTLDHLREILRADPGIDDSVELTAENATEPFAELGYDSLALLEFASQLRRRYGVQIPDDALEEMSTPVRAVDFVNRLLDSAGTRPVEV